MTNDLAYRLAEYGVALRFEQLPQRVVHEVKRRVIDSLACALGAWSAEPCAIARRLAGQIAAEPGALVWGTARRSSADWAAFANGCLVRYLDDNDTYLSKEPAHPSDNIPACVAVAESVRADGRDLITAIALAYEVQCRLCDAASLRARGWDHVTYGAFSTALASARLMRLDAARARHALGIAGVAAVALRQSRVGELSHWKGCAFAHAARHGVFAAMLAREGMSGPAPIFEGEKGFEKLVSGPLELDPAQWKPAGLQDWMILKTSIKLWPAEYHSQSAIEAALKLRTQINRIEQIASVTVHSHDAAVDIIGSEPEKWRPSSRETADHSLPYIVAAALTDGEITLRQFEPQRFTDRRLLELTGRVRIQRDAELTARYPESVGNIVVVKLADGRILTERVDHPKGHARNPLSDGELEDKYLALVEPVLDRDRVELLLHWLWALEEKTDLNELGPLLEVAR
jgi:2-methylcitrate dehydratase